MYYKNVSFSEKTFYGVTFKPGDIKEVPNYINNRFMIPVDSKEVKVSTQQTSHQITKQQKPSSEKPKKSEEKKESEVSVADVEILSDSST